MEDEWFADKFSTISGQLGGIDSNQKTLFKKVDKINGTIEKHGVRIQTLETHEAVEEEKEKWIKRNPIKTGIGIGGVSFATLVGIVATALNYFGVI